MAYSKALVELVKRDLQRGNLSLNQLDDELKNQLSPAAAAPQETYTPPTDTGMPDDFDPEMSDPSLQWKAAQYVPPTPAAEFYSPEGGYIAPASGGEPLWQQGDAAKVAFQALKVPYNLGFGGGPETDVFTEPTPAFTKQDMQQYQESMAPQSPLGKGLGWGAEQLGLLPFYATAEATLGAGLVAGAGKIISPAGTAAKDIGYLNKLFPKLTPAIEKAAPYVQTFASGFGSGAPVGAMEAYGAGEPLPDVAKAGLTSGLTFGGFNVGLKGAGNLIKSGLNRAAELPGIEAPGFGKQAASPAMSITEADLAGSINKIPAYVNPEVYQGIQKMQRPAYVNPQVWDSLNRPAGAGSGGPIIQGAKYKTELPAMPTIAPKVSAEVMPTGGIPRPAAKTGPAIWRNNGIDTPVTVTGEAGRDKLGRQYVRVEGSNTAVLADEIRQSADNGLMGEGSISAAKFTIPEKMADVGDGTKVRSLGVSVMENPSTPSDVKAGLLMESMEGGANTYGPITNKETLIKAAEMVDADINTAIRYTKENPDTALSNTIKLKLMEKANAEGRWDDAVDIATEAAGGGTTQGQAVQALILWSKLKPEGMQKFYAKTIEGVNKDIAKRGNQLKKLKLDPKIMEDIKTKMDDIGKLPEGRDKVIKTAQVLDTIAAQIPVPFLRKVASIQTMAQLLNPKTAIRNLAGNFGFAGIENMSDVVGAVADKGISLLTGKRTKVLPSIMAQLRGGKQGWKHGLEEALLGIDTTGLATKQDLPMGKVFRGKIGGKLETALAVELRATDRSFYQAAYDGSLNNQMRAAKVSVPTQEMKDIAHYDGLYRTFQDDNAVSALFRGIKHLLNAKQEFGIGDFVIKYPRTPANLLVRGIEYSPAGFIKTIIEAAKPLAKREFNQKAFVESFSRALVGSTTLVGTGALLNKLGIITGAPVADKDLAELQREQGFGEYRINVSALKRLVFGGDTKRQLGDKIIDYSWFQPMAIAIAIGADINANKGNATGIVGTILQSFATGINALADQPVTQGIQTLLGGGYGDSTQGLTQVLTGIPSSFVPTLLNQIKQLADNQRRETYDPNKKQKALNLAINKIPGLAGKLPAKYSTLGQPLETYQDKSNNPFNVFINPAFVNTYNPSPEMQKVNDIYEQTGAVNQVPRVAPKSITVSGQTFPLTGEEFATYQRLVGEYTQQGFAKVSVGTKPEEAAKKMQDIMTDANTKAKTQILQARGIRVIKSGGGIAIK